MEEGVERIQEPEIGGGEGVQRNTVAWIWQGPHTSELSVPVATCTRPAQDPASYHVCVEVGSLRRPCPSLWSYWQANVPGD